MKQRFYLSALATLAARAMDSTAYAAKSAESDALAIDTAKISMTRAVSAAEQHVGGKAVRAEYAQHKGQRVFDVEVVKGKQVMDVMVDSASGKVIATREDKVDLGGEHDKAD
jgi:uncharacterized membrane protein YkoI